MNNLVYGNGKILNREPLKQITRFFILLNHLAENYPEFKVCITVSNKNVINRSSFKSRIISLSFLIKNTFANTNLLHV